MSENQYPFNVTHSTQYGKSHRAFAFLSEALAFVGTVLTDYAERYATHHARSKIAVIVWTNDPTFGMEVIAKFKVHASRSEF